MEFKLNVTIRRLTRDFTYEAPEETLFIDSDDDH